MVQNIQNEDSLYMMHLVCKVFYVSNQLTIAPIFLEDYSSLDPWIHFFKTLLDM